MTVNDFWCNDCEKDLPLPAYKEKNRYGEWWKARCPFCRRDVIRYISENHLDPYFRKSKKLMVERDRMKVDLLQPGDPGFQTHYKKQHDELSETKRKIETKGAEREKLNQKLYKDMTFNGGISHKEANKLIEVLEEKDA